MSLHDAFERIVASLHQAALDDAHWPVSAGLVDQIVGIGGNTLVVGKGHAAGEGQIYLARFCSRGELREDQQRTYFVDYYPRDERLPRLAVAPHGRLGSIADLYTPAELKTSAAYNEFLPQFGYQNGLNVRLDLPDGASIVWTLADSTARGGWQPAQIELIEHLLPHLSHFVLVRQALAGVDAVGASLTGLLDNSRIGVMHLDRGARVMAANAPALDILRRGDGLSDNGGALHAWLPADQEHLQKLLGRGLQGESRSGGSMTVRRPSGGAALGLHISPVGGAQADFGARRVAALMLLVDPAGHSRIDPVRVAQALGLTPTEGRVAALLAEGNSVRDIAAATGNTAGTVRLFLKHCYKKQGVSGQIPLVRRVLAVDALPRD